ncbi:MAG: hypothetical protein NZZ41_04360 [Candidatus Dojkabacteria bacterium]|nr:hypothetical protein [Candidatus Dojkabacteria bacterium]
MKALIVVHDLHFVSHNQDFDHKNASIESLATFTNTDNSNNTPKDSEILQTKILNKIFVQPIVNYVSSEISYLQNTIYNHKLEKEIKKNVDILESFLKRYGSPLVGYGDIIVRESFRCNVDYRIIVGIAGIESGLGKYPIGKYNPFGYLDGVIYESWEEVLYKLICRIANQFIKPCNNDLYCIVNRYGGPDTPKQRWVNAVQWFMNQL